MSDRYTKAAEAISFQAQTSIHADFIADILREQFAERDKAVAELVVAANDMLYGAGGRQASQERLQSALAALAALEGR